MSKIWKTLALLALLWSCLAELRAQTRDVLVNDDGVVVAPANLWEANPAASIGGPYNPEYVLATVAEIPRGVEDSSSTATNFDQVLTTFIFDPLVTDWAVDVSILRDELGSGLTFATSDPAVATVSSQGIVTHVTDGAFDLTLTVGAFERVFPLVNTTTPQGESTLITGGPAGSLREALTRPIDEALALSSDITMFSVRDHATGTYTRNPTFWGWPVADAAAWSAIPVRWSGHPTILRGGTLIAPDIIATTTHYPSTIGSSYTYAEPDGTLHVRTVTHRRTVSGDLTIARLDSPLPAAIPPMPIMPNVGIYGQKSISPSLGSVPVFGLNKFLQASVRDFQPQGGAIAPQLPDRLATFVQMVSGDSSGAVVFADGTSLIYLFGWTTNQSGVPLGNHVAAIEAAIADMGSSSEITLYDVSGFPDYSNAPPGPGQ